MGKKNLLKKKANDAGIRLEDLSPEIREAFANQYVENVWNRKLVYTRAFYRKMAELIRQGKTYVEAYRTCGFDIEALGEDRANAAGRRAVEMERDGSLYRVSPTEMDATIPLDQMDPNMDDAHRLAYLEGRCMYLEAALEYEKEKKRLIYQEALSGLRSPSEKRQRKL